MRIYLYAAVAVLGLATLAVRAADSNKELGVWTGVLIDNACGDKQKDEASALKHPASCALKEKCATSGYQLIVGDKHYKLDDRSNKLAKAHLEKLEKKDQGAKVTITGQVKGEKMDITKIEGADDVKRK